MSFVAFICWKCIWRRTTSGNYAFKCECLAGFFFVCVLILLDFEQHSREFVYSNKIAIRSVAVEPRGVFFLLVGHLHVWLYSGKQSSTAHPATLHVIKIMRFYPICKWANFMNIFLWEKTRTILQIQSICIFFLLWLQFTRNTFRRNVKKPSILWKKNYNNKWFFVLD